MILAIDIGGSKMMVGLVDNDGKAKQKKIRGLAPDITETELLENILMLSRSVMAEEADVKIDAAGVTIPGLADAKRGIWLYACFSGIENFPIADALSLDLQIPVFISNDVNACAFGEMDYGACRENRNFMWVTVSNGIGGGLVLDGRIYEGSAGCSGEIGHIIVAENGNLCDCGNRGCLEAHASGRAIVRNYYAKKSAPITNESLESISAKQVAERARAGELAAIQAYREAGYYLGKAIAGAVNMINPEKVILGGGVSLAHDLFMPELKSTVDKMAFKAANRHLIIQHTDLLYDAALIGAAAVARRQLKEMS